MTVNETNSNASSVNNCLNDSINYLSWNVRGLLSNWHQVEFISFIKQFDVIGLVETWATNVNSFNLQGFTCFESIRKKTATRGRPSGGIACLVKQTLCKFVTRLDSDLIDVIWLKLDLPNNPPIIMGTVYISPQGSSRHSNDDIFILIESDMALFRERYSNCSFMLFGDFNARTGGLVDLISFDSIHHLPIDDNIYSDAIVESVRNSCDNQSNQYGHQLIDLCKAASLCIVNGRSPGDSAGEFTYMSSLGQSVVDYLIVSQSLVNNVSHFNIGNREDSDHFPLEFTLRVEKVAEASNTPTTPSRYLTKYACNYDTFLNRYSNGSLQDNYNDFISSVDSATDVQRDVVNFNNLFYKVARPLGRNNKSCPAVRDWFDNDCTRCKRKVNTLLNIYRTSHSHESLINYKREKREYRNLIKSKKQKFQYDTIDDLKSCLETNNPRKFWLYFKTSKNSIPDSISCEEWYDYFYNLYNPRDPTSSGEFNELWAEMKGLVDNILNGEADLHMNDPDGIVLDTLDQPISENEIRESIEYLKNNKSPGIDGIPAEFFKKCSNIIVPLLWKLFNKIFNTGDFPESWGEGIIFPIYKKGNKSQANNYRGITLLPIISKIYTRILHCRLLIWEENCAHLREEQAGFRKGYSTTDNIFILYTFIQKYLSEKGGRFYCAFIDFEKAFDRVHRNILFYKLGKSGLRGKMFNSLSSIYNKVKASVLGCSGLTASFDCPLGVRQGCILSPFLFAFFINDLHEEFRKGGVVGGCPLGLIKIFYLLFADDLILIAESVIRLQRLLNHLNLYCQQNRLVVNLDKSNIVVFRNGGPLKRNEKWFYIGKSVPVVSHFKYLGLVFSSSGLWTKAQTVLAEQASKAMFSLGHKINYVRNAAASLCLNIFDVKILPILHYGCEVWGYINGPDIEKLQTKFCKQILSQHSHTINVAIRGELGRPTLRSLRLHRMVAYWLRLLGSSPNRYIYQTYLAQCELLDSKKECWLFHLKQLLFSYGFADVWYNQGVGHVDMFMSQFKQRCLDIDAQTWHTTISNYNRLATYSLFKTTLNFEFYLNIQVNPAYKRTLTAFRISAHTLMIEQGRHRNLPRDERLCSCNLSYIEDEFHFLLICPLYQDIRHQYIPIYFYQRPNIQKFC